MSPSMEPQDFSLEKLSKLSPEGMAETKQRKRKAVELTEKNIQERKPSGRRGVAKNIKEALSGLSELSKEKIAEKKERTKRAMELTEARIQKLKEEVGVAKREKELKKLPHIKSGPRKEVSEALKELRAVEKQKIKKQEEKLQQDFTVEKSEEEPYESYEVLPAEKTESEEESAETKEALKELRAVEKQKIKKQEEKLRQDIAEKKPEEELYEASPEKKSGKEKKDEAMAEYLKHAISDHPELMTPEIKKNVDIIKKQEAIIMKNEGNAKKSAQDKIKNAKEVIKRAQSAVEDYNKDIIKDYKESSANLKDVGETAETAQNKLFSDKYNQYDVGQNSIARFFKERKLKKQLKPKDFEKFEELKMAYYDAFGRYDQLLKKHMKKYSRLEEALEAGTSFHLARRGGGERLPGIKGR